MYPKETGDEVSSKLKMVGCEISKISYLQFVLECPGLSDAIKYGYYIDILFLVFGGYFHEHLHSIRLYYEIYLVFRPIQFLYTKVINDKKKGT